MTNSVALIKTIAASSVESADGEGKNTRVYMDTLANVRSYTAISFWQKTHLKQNDGQFRGLNYSIQRSTSVPTG